MSNMEPATTRRLLARNLRENLESPETWAAYLAAVGARDKTVPFIIWRLKVALRGPLSSDRRAVYQLALKGVSELSVLMKRAQAGMGFASSNDSPDGEEGEYDE